MPVQCVRMRESESLEVLLTTTSIFHYLIFSGYLPKFCPIIFHDSYDISIGQTPLHHSAYNGHAGNVKALIEAGADMNAQNVSNVERGR